jgi:hypothetical protein
MRTVTLIQKRETRALPTCFRQCIRTRLNSLAVNSIALCHVAAQLQDRQTAYDLSDKKSDRSVISAL